LKIALDATYSLDRHLSGVGVYSREILFGLLQAHPEAAYLSCYRPHRFLRSFAEHLPANCTRSLLWKGWPSSQDLFHALNQRIDSARYRRTVATFHDLFVLSGEYSTPEFRQRFAGQARLAAERADLIIAVSAFTAAQVTDLLKVEPTRIRVVHHGVRRVAIDKPAPPRENIILFVGAIQRRKNVIRLLEAFEREGRGWKLLLAGSSGFGGAEIERYIETSPRRADIDVLGYVTAARLEDLYARASIFAFPSLDEGFGMPVLEAMARGVPVLTSNRSALLEISGDAALLVNPLDVDSIADGLRSLIDSEDLRAGLIAKGLMHSARFTWEKAVEETWSVYRELLG
jgi:glycosyltransferase involved in cell wall biosynthesis